MKDHKNDTPSVNERRERDLRDPRLTRELRAALSGDLAPTEWIAEALRVPETHNIPAPKIAREPVVLLLLPQICGVLILVAMIAVLLFRSDLVGSLVGRFVPTIASNR